MIQTEQADVYVENHGSLFMVTPLSDSSRQWVQENVATESWQWLGSSFSVEHRYMQNLVSGMQEAGLCVGPANQS